MEHTDGKIRTNRGMGDTGVDVSYIWSGENKGDGNLMGEVFYEEFAQRLVLCWNALIDIPTEVIKHISLTKDLNDAIEARLSDLQAQLSDALKQRDELVEACKKARKCWGKEVTDGILGDALAKAEGRE